ncbi:MAG: type II secretion system minor pseudopilin GspK [Gammaproteobacteria bacterium]
MARWPAGGPPPAEDGVALVTALLVVALATTAAAALISQQQIDFARTENLFNSEQAYQYGLGVESWAAGLLAADRTRSEIDHVHEPWATRLEPVAADAAVVSGYIEDMQGRLNLNNLVEAGETGVIAKERFQSLLGIIGAPLPIADALVHWLNTDGDTTSPKDRASEASRSKPPLEPVTKAKMVQVSELRLVEGVTQEIYRALAPYVAALPAATAVNVNTAPAPVLMSLVPGLRESEAQSLIGARGKTGFARVEGFLAQVSLLGRHANPLGLGVASDYFQTQAEVRIGRARVHLTSLLWRPTTGLPQVILRSETAD